jgi:hypothetical protein
MAGSIDLIKFLISILAYNVRSFYVQSVKVFQ